MFCVSISAANAYPQAPPDAGTLLQEQQKTQPRMLDRLTPFEAPEKERAQIEETGRKFMVKGFRFTGYEGLVTEAELQEVLRDAVGKEAGVIGLKRLADRVTKYLQKKGWFLARAYVPQQEIRDGVVEIAIVSGRLQGKALIRGENLRISETRLEKMAEPALQGEQAARQDELVRSLLLMNDLPGIRASSTLEPGEAEGTARVVVDATEGPLLSGGLWGDNYGSRFTGSYRGSALLQLNDPFRFGDQVSLTSTDNPFYQYGQAGYSFPIGYRGLRAGITYTEMRYRIDEDLVQQLGLDGGSRSVGATLNYPVIRSRTANLWTGVRYDWKNLWDDVLETPRDNKYVNVGSVVLYGDLLDTFLGGGYSIASLSLTGGHLDRSDVPADLIADDLTARTDGIYGKMNYGISRLQKIYNKLNLFLSVNGQLPFQNLDTSEKFLLGGPTGVRAYPVGEAPGDGGGIFTAELRYDLPEIWKLGLPQLVGFYDLGWTQLNMSPFLNSGTDIGNKNHYTISGAGVGLNITKAKLYTIRAAWAATLGNNPGRSFTGLDADGNSDDNRYWVQALVMF